MLEIDDLDHVYYEVRAASGDFVAGRKGLPQPVVTADRRPQYYNGVHAEQNLRLVALRVSYDPDDEDALGQVIVGETLIKRRALAQDILSAVALTQLALIAMVSLAVYLGVGHGLLPLGRLRQQIESRSYRDLAPLSESETPREVRPVVHAINELMERLQRAIASQQRFVADAAHQLRTPLAGLKMHAELALRENTITGMRERIVALTQATDRSARLEHQLLSLARAEPESCGTQVLTTVELGKLARETATEWVPRALERDIDLGFNAAEAPLEVQGNAVLLREALANLIDNAIRYGRAGGRITVGVERTPDAAVLTVEDDGAGIAPEDRERVFERFQRLADASIEGCGLGLAIVREIAQMHDATAVIESGGAGAGTRVSIHIPLPAIRPPEANARAQA